MLDLSYMCLECLCMCERELVAFFYFFNAYLCMGGVVAQWGMGASGLLHRVSQ